LQQRRCVAEGDRKNHGRGSVAGAQQRFAEPLQGSSVKAETTKGRLAWTLREDAACESGSVLFRCPWSPDTLGRGRRSVRENRGRRRSHGRRKAVGRIRYSPSWLGFSALTRATRAESRWRSVFRERRPPNNAKAVAPTCVSRGSNPGPTLSATRPLIPWRSRLMGQPTRVHGCQKQLSAKPRHRGREMHVAKIELATFSVQGWLRSR
jgi:hypothetical protein